MPALDRLKRPSQEPPSDPHQASLDRQVEIGCSRRQGSCPRPQEAGRTRSTWVSLYHKCMADWSRSAVPREDERDPLEAVQEYRVKAGDVKRCGGCVQRA